jgi:hypothetical protein
LSLKAKGISSFWMDQVITGPGKIVKCMGKESIPGKMDLNMREDIKMEKNKGMESSIILQENNTSETGSTGNRTESVK